MRIDFLQEPELEFGVDRHVDIRFGLMNYGPVDFASSLAPKEIRLGIVGTNETIEGVNVWLGRCREEIPAKSSRQPHLFPKFPGFRTDVAFQSTLLLDSKLQRTISSRQFEVLKKQRSPNQAIRDAVELFVAELCQLTEKTSPHVLMCAVPQSLLELTDTYDTQTESEKEDTLEDEDVPDEKGTEATAQNDGLTRLNFHHLLKAKAMDLKVPIQLIVPSTYDETKRRLKKISPKEMTRLQDEATRAWNLHTALYYKAKGVPWRLPRSASDLATCYVGVSFYETLDRTALLTSVAQIFNERGEGVIVRGGPAKILKQDRRPHLDDEGSFQLLKNALDQYRSEHYNLPARIVVHKSSSFTNEESEGFTRSAREQRIEMVDLLSLDHTASRLFRVGAYPPLRGTFLSLDEKSHLLYTRGSVEFFSTYPGMYVPLPLLFRCERIEQTPKFLANEILSLTKMNWNNTEFDGADPITLHAAKQVSQILKYVDQGDIASSYRFYM